MPDRVRVGAGAALGTWSGGSVLHWLSDTRKGEGTLSGRVISWLGKGQEGGDPPEDSNVVSPEPLAPAGPFAPGPRSRHPGLSKGHTSAAESPPAPCALSVLLKPFPPPGPLCPRALTALGNPHHGG